MSFDPILIGTALFGYLLGSIPFGLFITRLAGLGDIREIGSGNIGATNVLRTGRKDLAIATLILDTGKGAIAVLITHYFIDANLAAMAGAAAFFGHCFPIYLKFKGGKGVATFFGTLIAINPLVAGITAGCWFLTAGLFRLSSLSALIAALIAPAYSYYAGLDGLWPYLTLMTAIIYIRHKDNILRIAKGEEPKIGKKK